MVTLFPTDADLREEERLRQKALSIGFPRVVAIPIWKLLLFALGFLFLIVWAALLWPHLPEMWRSDHKLTVLFFVALPFFIVHGWLQDLRQEIRNRSLLELGQATSGHVTSQTTTGGKSKSSRITYTFMDQSGLECTGKGVDYTRKYLEGMPVIVFFDRSDPKENVAACCTTWKLKSPDGKFIDLN
jgi:hypothetical protein